MKLSFPVNYVKQQANFFYFFSNNGVVFEKQSLCKNGMSFRLQEPVNKDSPRNFKMG